VIAGARGGRLTVVFFGIFFLSLLFSFALTRYVRDVASRRGWVAIPSQERHLHATPLPRLGGVAIFISFSLSMVGAALVSSYLPRLHSALSVKTLLTILVPASIVFFLGVYDDLRAVGPYVKFAVQSVAATMLFLGGLRILNIPVLFGEHQLPWFVGLPLTILWVLAITNAFNLIDGLDGLAAGSALFSTLVAFVVALLNGYSLVTIMTIALAGAILGFLRYNFNPATIFLGDSGSLFIGFLLSALALEGAQKAPNHCCRRHSGSFFRTADSGNFAVDSAALDQRASRFYGRPRAYPPQASAARTYSSPGRDCALRSIGHFRAAKFVSALAYRKFAGLGACGVGHRHLDRSSAPWLFGTRRVGSSRAAYV